VITRLRRHIHRQQRGQSLLEMTMILPVFLLLVLGTLEFGMAFDHNLTLEYASREGVRTGSALANGGGVITCSPASVASTLVDDQIIAAVERVLASNGSPIDLTKVTEIHIYKVPTANPNGSETAGSINRWIYAAGQGPVVGGTPLDFKKDLAVQGWPGCSRNNGAGADSIGVSINYTYNFQTPLGALLSMVKIDMHDQTVMQLNPTGK
jgi:TadE-like protein